MLSSTILSILLAIILFGETENLAVKLTGTAIRTGVVFVMAWLIVFMKGKQTQLKQIDKLSIVIAVAFSYIVFKERLSKKAFIGLLLLVFGTLIMSIWS